MKTTRLKFIEFVDERCPNFLSTKSSSRQEAVARMISNLDGFWPSSFRSETFRFTIRLEKALQFFLSNRNNSTVAWMEIHTDSMVNHFEVFQIDTFRKLVFAFHIHIIHQDVLIRANQWKDTRTLYCILRLLLIVI